MQHHSVQEILTRHLNSKQQVEISKESVYHFGTGRQRNSGAGTLWVYQPTFRAARAGKGFARSVNNAVPLDRNRTGVQSGELFRRSPVRQRGTV